MPSTPLRPEDLLVEFRDKHLTRQGSIPLEDLQLKMQPVVNGVGSWSLTMPSEHRAVPYLRTPGSGIIVTNVRTKETILSGPTSKPSKRATSADPVGMATISGLTDDRLLWDALAFPNPSIADPLASSQSRANDTRTDRGEGLMRQYVAFNIANGAIAPSTSSWAPAGRLGGLRNYLRLAAVDAGLGTPTTRRPRFDILGDLLVGIAAEQGLAFRIVQIGAFLEFQVYQPSDRTAEIRLDVNNGTLQEQNVEFAPPEVTRMVVAGQGEGTERQFVSMTSDDATAAEAAWGLIIEEWKDQRQTDVVSELEAAALERLNEAGFTKVAVKATPANETTMIFMEDFFLGDKVSVVIDGQEQPNSHITEAAIVVNSEGIKTAVAIGDIMDFDSDSALRQTVSDTQRRVDNLERNAEAMPMETILNALHPVGSIYMSTVNTNPGAIFGGTWVKWGAGRVPVGHDPAQSEFNASEKTGGAKTHTLSVGEMPGHRHYPPEGVPYFVGSSPNGTMRKMQAGGALVQSEAPGADGTWYARLAEAPGFTPLQTGATGGGGAHNNLQPYITCYMFKRTA